MVGSRVFLCVSATPCVGFVWEKFAKVWKIGQNQLRLITMIRKHFQLLNSIQEVRKLASPYKQWVDEGLADL